MGIFSEALIDRLSDGEINKIEGESTNDRKSRRALKEHIERFSTAILESKEIPGESEVEETL